MDVFILLMNILISPLTGDKEHSPQGSGVVVRPTDIPTWAFWKAFAPLYGPQWGSGAFSHMQRAHQEHWSTLLWKSTFKSWGWEGERDRERGVGFWMCDSWNTVILVKPKISIQISTLPISTASAKHSFSTTERLKTSAQHNDRLAGLAFMNIHTDTKIDGEEVSERFLSSCRRSINCHRHCLAHYITASRNSICI